jgi:DNA-binding transcriptional LysR family regulator
LRQFVSESAAGDNPSRPGLKTFPSIACESVTMMRNIVVKSDAVALLPLNILIPDLEAKAIAILPLSLPWMQSDFGIVRLARRSLSPLGELFVRKMVEVDAEVAAVEEKAARRLVARRKLARSGHVKAVTDSL